MQNPLNLKIDSVIVIDNKKFSVSSIESFENIYNYILCSFGDMKKFCLHVNNENKNYLMSLSDSFQDDGNFADYLNNDKFIHITTDENKLIILPKLETIHADVSVQIADNESIKRQSDIWFYYDKILCFVDYNKNVQWFEIFVGNEIESFEVA